VRPAAARALVGGLLACLAALLAAGPAAAVAKSSSGDVQSYGDPSELAYLKLEYIFVASPQVEGYVRQVIGKLLAASGRKLKKPPSVLIYSADVFDARSDVDGNMLIATRTLRELGSEDELAALLAHELSHLLLGHGRSKSALRAFPLGVETAGWIAAASDRSAGNARSQAQARSGDIGDFGHGALANAQYASMIWSDILMPGWNRAQERAADSMGFDIMVAAGYDPSAFGSLFSRLQDARAQRSARMQLLQKVAEERLARSDKPPSDAGFVATWTGKVKAMVRHQSVEAVFNAIGALGSNYDTPAKRQELLAAHAEEKHLHADRKPRSPRFRQNLREGSGGTQLAADGSALKTVAAIVAKRNDEARRLVAPILPPAGGDPLTPHLNYALGAWYIADGHPELGEARASAWLRSARPPAQAYLWRAYYQWARKDYLQEIATLESGGKRIGSLVPFLPHMVTAARSLGQKKRAEGYVKRCAAEDRKNPNLMMSLITFQGNVAPSGIYAECVRRLGYAPADEQSTAMKMIMKPVELGKSLTGKIRTKFKGGSTDKTSP
jgi:Zn-dependent protease with chaperone function